MFDCVSYYLVFVFFGCVHLPFLLCRFFLIGFVVMFVVCLFFVLGVLVVCCVYLRGGLFLVCVCLISVSCDWPLSVSGSVYFMFVVL